MATITGTSGDDDLTSQGTPADDVIEVTDGNDAYDGGGGTDTYDATGSTLSAGTVLTVNVNQAGVGTVNKVLGGNTDQDFFSSVEVFAAPEDPAFPSNLDTINVAGAVEASDISGSFVTGATGTFTRDSDGMMIQFGGLGQPTLQDLLSSPDPVGSYDTLSVGSPTSPGESGTIGNISFSGFEVVSFNVICFARGTRIRAERIRAENGAGAAEDLAEDLAVEDLAVEDLAIGDLVDTRDHGAQPIRWIGSRRVPALGALAPVVIKAGAMGNDRDLTVSPQHRMLVTGWRAELLFGENEVLVAAKHLVNGDTIYVADGGEIEYFHILFDTHELVMANGAWSESFHPGEIGLGAMDSAARHEIYTLFPELQTDTDAFGSAARTTIKAHEARVLANNPTFLG